MFGVFTHVAHLACALLFEQLQPADIENDNEFGTERRLTNIEMRSHGRPLGRKAACIFVHWSLCHAGGTKR